MNLISFIKFGVLSNQRSSISLLATIRALDIVAFISGLLGLEKVLIWHSNLIRRGQGSHETERVRYAPITGSPLSSLTSRSICRRKLFLPLCRLTHHLPSPLPLSLSCDKCQSAGRCKWPKQGQVSSSPAKAVLFPNLLKGWRVNAVSEDITLFPLSLSGASRCFGALHWSSKHPRNSPSPLLIRVRSLNCMLAYIRRRLASFPSERPLSCSSSVNVDSTLAHLKRL